MLARMVSISWLCDLSTSASQSAGITGVSYRIQPVVIFDLKLSITDGTTCVYLKTKYVQVLQQSENFGDESYLISCQCI